MNNSIYRISLDLHDTSSQTSLSVKKVDTARSIHITLTEKGKPYKIAEGCYAVFRMKKPADKNGNRAIVYNDCVIEGNTIIYDLTSSNTEIVGAADCEITLYGADGKSLTSPHFSMVIATTVNTDGEVETIGHNEFTALVNATTEAKAVTEEVEQKLANGDFIGEKGAKGDKGDKGDQGIQGAKGDKGDKGEDADPNLFANAVIGSASGEVVRVDDVSPVEHNVKVKVDHTNPSSVTVTRCGKNLLPVYTDLTTKTVNGITFTVNEDKSVTLSGTATANAILTLTPYYKLPLGVYKLSGCPIDGNENVRLQTNRIVNGAGSTGAIDIGNGGVLNVTDNYDLYTYIVVISGYKVSNFTFKPMLQFRTDTDTSYEIPITQTYTPNADGTVEGITSISPTMTLLTDTEGAVIHCEYNRDTNKVLTSGGAMVTNNGTVVSQNADFGEVAEWGDGNPNNEDRTGYFVCADVPVHGIVMKKATSTDDVKGVTILAPAFAGNYSKDKVDSNGNLLPQYSYVAIIGFVPVIDNGTCEVGGRCMPDDNGCAIPSSNNMGYQVVNRVDENRVLIIIEPNGDMVQRIKADIGDIETALDGIIAIQEELIGGDA